MRGRFPSPDCRNVVFGPDGAESDPGGHRRCPAGGLGSLQRSTMPATAVTPGSFKSGPRTQYGALLRVIPQIRNLILACSHDGRLFASCRRRRVVGQTAAGVH